MSNLESVPSLAECVPSLILPFMLAATVVGNASLIIFHPAGLEETSETSREHKIFCTGDLGEFQLKLQPDGRISPAP